MRILLLGEFSGFYNSLAEGLKLLGHDVFLANNGDGTRGFYADLNWNSTHKGKLGLIHSYINLFENRDIFTGFDVVQLIRPNFFHDPLLNKWFINYLKNRNDKLFWTPAGASDIVFKYWIESKDLRVGIYDFLYQEAKDKGLKLRFERKRNIDYELWFIEHLNGIIPTVFEYTQPFRSHNKNLGTLPFPINIDILNFEINQVTDKIVFYHGITRPEKGTQYICKAFMRMKDKYNNVAEFICNKNLPYNEYIKVLGKANVVIDQTNSYSSGINGLISLAKGKIVMGGGDPIGFAELGYKSCPIINITSNVEQICSEIERIINDKDKIVELSKASRLFIEEYHDYKIIAKRYVDKWINSNIL